MAIPIYQSASSGELLGELANRLGSAQFQRMRAVVAFATEDGLLLLLNEGGLDAFLKTGGGFECLIGIDAVTTPECLRQCRILEASGVTASFSTYTSGPGNGLFHPKAFLLERPDGSGVVIVGSNNLTRGGLLRNTELAATMDLAASDLASWNELFDKVFEATVVRPITEDLIADVQSRHRRELRVLKAARVANVRTEQAAELDDVKVLLRVATRDRGGSQLGIPARHVASFFQLGAGLRRTVTLQQTQPGQPPGPVETRPLVHPPTNQNSRLEVSGLRNWPLRYAQPPIIVFQEVSGSLFRYTILEPGSPGHTRVAGYLSAQRTRGNELPSAILTLSELLSVLPDYAL